MSSQNPNPRRRRRIAGERQGRAETTSQAERPEPAGTADREAPDGTGPDDPGYAAPPREPQPVPGWLLAVLALVAAALVLVATVGVADGMGVRGYQQLQEQQEVEQTRRTAPAAAERAASAILAYDYRSLEADRDAAKMFMTPDYRKKYQKTFGLVLQNAPELEAVVTAQVKASGIVHADPDRANVLLFVDQVTTSRANDRQPQRALNRVVFAMEERDGSWLVDGITAY